MWIQEGASSNGGSIAFKVLVMKGFQKLSCWPLGVGRHVLKGTSKSTGTGTAVALDRGTEEMSNRKGYQKAGEINLP